MFARPRATDIIASVAMKGGTRKAVMSTPDTIPQRPAATRAIRMETGSGTPTTLASQPITIMASARTDPTERSMPPMRITKRHADGHDAKDRDLVEDVQGVANGQEGVRREGQEDAEQDEADQRSGRPAQRAEAGRAPAPDPSRWLMRAFRPSPGDAAFCCLSCLHNYAITVFNSYTRQNADVKPICKSVVAAATSRFSLDLPRRPQLYLCMHNHAEGGLMQPNDLERSPGRSAAGICRRFSKPAPAISGARCPPSTS